MERENTFPAFQITPQLVSVVTATLNQANRIEKFVRNVSGQNYRPLELIIVDGRSVDGTVEIAEGLAKELSDRSFSMRLLDESEFGPRRSVGNARNIGSRMARGQYEIFLDPDMSFLKPDDVDSIVRKLSAVVFTKVRTTIVVDTELEGFLARTHARYHHCAFRRDLLTRVQFDPSLGVGEDLDFIYRIKRDLGVNVDETCDVLLARHLPHTKSELLRQTVWYAGNMPNFIGVVLRRREYEFLVVIYDWLRFWSYCFLPFLTVQAAFADYLRGRGLQTSLSFLLWNSVVRRYFSFSHFLISAAKSKTLQLVMRLLVSYMWTRMSRRLSHRGIR